MWEKSIPNANDSTTKNLFPATRESAVVHNNEVFGLNAEIRKLNDEITDLKNQLKEAGE